jgi:hypothetical protein
MTPLKPVALADRDPKMVFVGLPITGDPIYELSRTLASLDLAKGEDNPTGWKFTVMKIGNQGLAKARNLLTFIARCTPASRLVMIDGDIPAKPAHVLQLLASGEEVVGALYPKKEFELKWVGEFEAADPKNPPPAGHWPAKSIGTGLIEIRMTAIDRILDRLARGRWFDHRPLVQWFESDEDAPVYGLQKGDRIHDVWGQGVISDDWFGRTYPRYLTEDYFFSYLCRKAGIPVWVDTRCQVGHLGRIDFLELANRIDVIAARKAAETTAADHARLLELFRAGKLTEAMLAPRALAKSV